MYLEEKKKCNLSEILSFTYPKYYSGKECYVGFYSYDPARQTMRRKKIKLNHIEKPSERKRYAVGLILRITKQLDNGWNPWIEQDHAQAYHPIVNVIEQYITYQEKLRGDGVLKENTVKDYLWRARKLLQYVTAKKTVITYIYQFDKKYICDYLDYIYITKRNSPRSRNNYLIWISSFCTWLIERGYIKSNPATDIKKLRVQAKKRDGISKKDLIALKGYLENKNKHYLLACRLLYYTMIRPSELLQIKVGNIMLKDMKIFIPAEISKNRKDGVVALNKELIESMLELKTFVHPDDYFLFGSGFKPSKKQGSNHQFRDYWIYNVRKDLHFPDTYQFYSLKDSGIRDLANSEGIVFARDQARHGDISTTNLYIKGNYMQVHEEVKHFKGDL